MSKLSGFVNEYGDAKYCSNCEKYTRPCSGRKKYNYLIFLTLFLAGLGLIIIIIYSINHCVKNNKVKSNKLCSICELPYSNDYANLRNEREIKHNFNVKYYEEQAKLHAQKDFSNNTMKQIDIDNLNYIAHELPNNNQQNIDLDKNQTKTEDKK